MRSKLPFAPACTARAINVSGSLQKTSILVVVILSLVGLPHPLFSGSPRKNAAPAISKPITDPKFQSSVAPSASLYQAQAAGASMTANITEITNWLFLFAISFSLSVLFSLLNLPRYELNLPGEVQITNTPACDLYAAVVSSFLFYFI